MVIKLNNNQKINYLEKLIIFLAILFKYLITYGVSTNLLYVFLAIIIILVFVDLFNKKIYKDEIRNVIILGIITCYFIIFYSEQNFLISFLLALVCLRRKDEDFVRTFFYSSIICFTLTLLLNSVGILEQNNMIRILDGENDLRYSLGFTHPNEVFLFFLPIVLSGFYLFSDKKLFYILVFGISTVLYNLTYCRTGFYIVMLFLFFVLIKKIFTKKSVKKIILIFTVILTILSIIIAIKFGSDINNNITKILSGRPYYWNYYINNGTIFTLFGHNKVEGIYLDNFYMYMLVEIGFIGYIIYIYIYYISLKKLNFDYRCLIIITIFLLYGLFEANVIIGSIQFLFALQLKSLIKKEEKIGAERKKIIH